VLAKDALTTDYELDLLSLLDQLQEVIETAPHLPLSDRVVVSADWMLDLLDAIRNAIPQDVIEAERLLQDQQAVLTEAREEASRLLDQAREQSKFMLQEHHIIKAAEMRAERLLNQARREAEEVLTAEVRKTAERCP
jgi:hypothetical protein